MMKRNVIICSLIFVLCSLFLASCINPFYPFQKVDPNEPYEPNEPGDLDCYNCGECEICDPVDTGDPDCYNCGECETCYPYDPVEPDFTFNVSNETQWLEARAAIANGGDGRYYAINITGNFSLPGDNNWDTFGTVTGITVLIRGTYTITLNSAGWFLVVNGGQTVVMRDLNLKGFSSNHKSVVYVDSEQGKSEFIMEGIASVSGNNLGGGNGGGVMGYGSLASFTMRDNAKVYDNSAIFGGGVHVSGGATLIMWDNASVYGNSAAYGGGVYVNEGTSFTMQGNSSVFGNSASFGGGVCISGIFGLATTFNMQGNSTVYDNTATTSSGGVYVGSGNIFTRSGAATVNNNNVTSPTGTGKNIGPYEIGDTGPRGGIVFYAEYAGFTVQGTGTGSSGVWPDSYRAHYLEAAPADAVGTYAWGTGAFDTSGVGIEVAIETAIGAGRKNTQLILNAAAAVAATAPAANAAYTYGTPPGEWFLPSKDELNELYINRNTPGLNLQLTATYYSSSDGHLGRPWRQNFSNGAENGTGGRSNPQPVRPIRAF